MLHESTLYADESDARFQKLSAGDDMLCWLVSVRELDDDVLGGPSAAYGWGTSSCSAGGVCTSSGVDGGGPEGGAGRCGSEEAILDQRFDVDELRERDSGAAGTSSMPFPALAGGDSGVRGSTADTTGDTGCELRDGLTSDSAVGVFVSGGTTSRPGVGSGGSGTGYSGGRMPKLPARLRLPLGCWYSPSCTPCFMGIGAVGMHLGLRGGG